VGGRVCGRVSGLFRYYIQLGKAETKRLVFIFFLKVSRVLHFLIVTGRLFPKVAAFRDMQSYTFSTSYESTTKLWSIMLQILIMTCEENVLHPRSCTLYTTMLIGVF